MKKLFLTAVAIAIVIALGSAVKPYWDKYWIQKELEVAAVYGTKNTLENTKVFLLNKLKEEGYRIGEDDIYIEKDSKNNVTVTVRYSDKISIFGKELQKLHFTSRRLKEKSKSTIDALRTSRSTSPDTSTSDRRRHPSSFFLQRHPIQDGPLFEAFYSSCTPAERV